LAKKKFFDKKEEVKENKEMEEKEVNVEENKVEETVTEKEPETEVQTSTGDVVTDEPSIEAPEIKTEETKVGKLANCELLNARKEPNKDSEVLFVIGKEDKIVILEEENDFYKVSVNGKEAYCMKNFIVVE